MCTFSARVKTKYWRIWVGTTGKLTIWCMVWYDTIRYDMICTRDNCIVIKPIANNWYIARQLYNNVSWYLSEEYKMQTIRTWVQKCCLSYQGCKSQSGWRLHARKWLVRLFSLVRHPAVSFFFSLFIYTYVTHLPLIRATTRNHEVVTLLSQFCREICLQQCLFK